VHIFFGSKIFEVSTFRSLADGTVGNTFGTMDEDVQRRDFTINALYFDPIKEHLIDYVNGVKDIKKGIIRPVIPLNIIFEEDPVRMLRAIKYAATTGFKIPRKLHKKIIKSAHLLSPVSPSRLTEELLKIINSGHSYQIVKNALKTDLYIYLQPSATALMYANKDYENNYLEKLVVDKKKVVIITDKEPDLKDCSVYLSDSLMENQIRLIVDSKYVLTGDFEDNIDATCLYSGQKNFVSLFKDAMRNEIELIILRSKESDEN
jgi:poly(A) polymerase